MNNKELIKEYPFLKLTDDDRYTWLDELEPGWKIAFGEQLCRDLKEALIEDGCLDSFQISEIKEKYAQLRIYAHGYNKNTSKVIEKYEDKSRYICGHCGKEATLITTGWYYPVCDDCAMEIYGSKIPIKKYWGK